MKLKPTLNLQSLLNTAGIDYSDLEIQYISYDCPDTDSFPLNPSWENVVIYARESVLHTIGAMTHEYSVGPLESNLDELDNKVEAIRAMQDGATHVGMYRYLNGYDVICDCRAEFTRK